MARKKNKRPNLSRFYGFELPPVTPGDFEFDLALLRHGRPAFSLNRVVESFEWIDEESVLTGNVQLLRPDAEDPASLPIAHGHRIRCRVRWDSAWYELWTMRCEPPQTQLDTHTVSVSLKDDLDLLTRNIRKWSFRITKHRKHGFFCHEILRAVAKKEGIRLGSVAKGTVRMPKLVGNLSALQVIQRAYQFERSKTGRRFVIRMRNGLLEVVPVRRNPMLYVLGPQIRTAMLTKTPASDHPATVIEGRGHIGKGKQAKKIRHTEYRRDLVGRFGYVHREKDYGRVDSAAELRSKVRRTLAQSVKVNTTPTVQHQGVPFIRRGDGCELDIPREGFKGKRAFVFVAAARHQVSGGVYTSEWDFTTEDPYVKLRDEMEKQQRAIKRRARAKRKRRG